MSTTTSNGGNGASGLRSTSALERLRARRQNGGSDPYSSDSSEKLANGSSGKINGDSNDTSTNAGLGTLMMIRGIRDYVEIEGTIIII